MSTPMSLGTWALLRACWWSMRPGFSRRASSPPGCSGSTRARGRWENCQMGVFCAYATPAGRALVDRELYLPKSWIADRDRCREAAVPDEVEFATKTELARVMLARALAAGVPATWVTADEAYGKDYKSRSWLEGRRVGRPRTSWPCTRPGRCGSAAAAARAPKGPGSMTGRSPPCPLMRTPPRPGGRGGCWSAVR